MLLASLDDSDFGPYDNPRPRVIDVWRAHAVNFQECHKHNRRCLDTKRDALRSAYRWVKVSLLVFLLFASLSFVSKWSLDTNAEGKESITMTDSKQSKGSDKAPDAAPANPDSTAPDAGQPTSQVRPPVVPSADVADPSVQFSKPRLVTAGEDTSKQEKAVVERPAPGPPSAEKRGAESGKPDTGSKDK